MQRFKEYLIKQEYIEQKLRKKWKKNIENKNKLELFMFIIISISCITSYEDIYKWIINNQDNIQ